MSSQLPNVQPSPPRERPALRILRRFVSVALTLAVTVILAGALLCGALLARETHLLFGLATGGATTVAFALGGLLALGAPTILLVVAARRRWLSWPALLSASAILAALVLWLVRDDPQLRRPLSVEDLSPAFDGADKSFAVLMRQSRKSDNLDTRAFALIKPAVTTSAPTHDPAEWRQFVTANRAGIEADWAALARARGWLAELNAFDRIGDLTPAHWDADIIRFGVWRMLAQRGCAVATLQAIDGRGDEAIATLLPLIEVGRKLGLSARTLVRLQIALTVERMSLETAGIVLATTPVGPAARGRLARAVAGGEGPGGARRIALVDFVQFSSFLRGLPFGDQVVAVERGLEPLRRPLNLLGRLYINPIATTNDYADYMFELAAFAESREYAKGQARQRRFVQDLAHDGRLKNIGGRLMLEFTYLPYDFSIRSYWDAEDLRAALAARLQKS